MKEKSERFEHWATVEVLGKKMFVGLVTEQVIAGAAFIRVDVPEVNERPAFTKFFGAGSIYCITPISEKLAREYLEQYRERPVEVYLDSVNIAERGNAEILGPVDDASFFS